MFLPRNKIPNKSLIMDVTVVFLIPAVYVALILNLSFASEVETMLCGPYHV